MSFQPGDVLFIEPQGTDDPEALLHKGERCTFVRYEKKPFRGSSSTDVYAVVQLDGNARRSWFQPEDLSEFRKEARG